jgi:putative protein kinase ArgK-like GTPase of G3E family
VAVEGRGAAELAQAADRHRAHMEETGAHQLGEVARARHVILQELMESAREKAAALLDGKMRRLVEDVAKRKTDAASAAQSVWREL